MIRTTRARAPVNLALVKYWGKRDPVRNLPQTSSLSATLHELGSIAEVSPSGQDRLDVQGDPSRARRVIEAARSLAGIADPLDVRIVNTVPTAVGLASSASSMAALSLALANALGIAGRPGAVEGLARLGSGSAVRSLSGGYVGWDAGTLPDGSDCVSRSVLAAARLPLAVRVAITTRRPKTVPSGDAMELTRRTSPEHARFVRENPDAMSRALSALAAGDLDALGRVAEEQSLRLHDVLRGASPPIDLLLPASRAAIDAVRRMRDGGVPCFFTMDAGSSVMVFEPEAFARTVEDTLASIPGVLQVLSDRVGDDGAVLLEGGT